jgi:hypothetical protein
MIKAASMINTKRAEKSNEWALSWRMTANGMATAPPPELELLLAQAAATISALNQAASPRKGSLRKHFSRLRLAKCSAFGGKIKDLTSWAIELPSSALPATSAVK